MKTFNLGDRVKVLKKNEKGRIAFIGKTNFSDGTWVGVILDNAVGKNNGTVADTCYFKCPTNNGIFVKASQLEKESAHDDQDQHHGAVSDEVNSTKYRIADAKCNEKGCLCGSKRLDIITAKTRIKSCQKDPNPQSLKHPIFKSQVKVSKKEDGLRELEFLDTLKAKTFIKSQNDSNPRGQNDPIFKTQLQGIKEKDCLSKPKRFGSLKTKRCIKCQNGPNPQSLEDPIFKSQVQVIKKDYLCESKRLGILKAKPRLKCENDPNPQNREDPIFKTQLQVIREDGCLCEPKRLGSLKTKLRIKCCQNDPNPQSLENPILKPEQQKFKKETCLCEPTQVGTLKAKPRVKCQFDPNPQSLDDPIFRSQLQVLKKENRHLRNKMQKTEKALFEVRGKYNETMEDNQLLKNEIRYKNKQIKIQKLHLKLLKMQCNSLHADSVYTVRDRVNHSEEDKLSGEQPDKMNGDSYDSDGEFSLEAIRAMTAMKRILHLEEENRIMFEGLVGLRNWFISEFRSQFQNIKSSRKRNRNHPKKTKNTPGSPDSSGIMKKEFSSVIEPTSQERECVKIVCEMKKFNEITIRSRGRRKQDETTNSSLNVKKSDNSTQKELVLFNKNFELGKHISNQLSSSRNSNSFLTISEICADSLTMLPDWKNSSLNNCQTSQQLSKLVSAKQEELSKPGLVDEIMNAVLLQRDVGFCQPTASLRQQQYMVKENSDHSSISEKFEVQPESSEALSVDANEITDKSSDGCVKVLPK